MQRWRCIAGTALVLVAAGCNDDSGASVRDGGTADTPGLRDGALPGGCVDDNDCSAGLVCHPYAKRCMTPGASCTDHGQCSNGTYCDDTLGKCLTGVTGSPCAANDNCKATCIDGVCGCDARVHQRQLTPAPLDVYLILDRTGSMGNDCTYTHGESPPRSSKACYATYALADYLIDATPTVDTRLAFHFMSQRDDCDGAPYLTPLVNLTQIPVPVNHALIQAIEDEDFSGGLGTHIEGALRGLAGFTAANQTAGREMIGVLMTDGDPNGCEENIGQLSDIIANHLKATGIRTFIIGMEGATESNLERLATAGGGDSHTDFCGGITPSCHYWNVGNGSGDAIARALQAIIKIAAPLPCHFSVGDLEPPEGESIDFNKVNVTLTQGTTTDTLGRVASEAHCPTDQLAWYYDDPSSPTQIHLCPKACTVVSDAGDGARLSLAVGCRETVIID